MTWIRTIDEAEADGPLKETYDRLVKAAGGVANILKVHSLRPRSLDTHLALYQDLMFGRSGLSRRLREAIAVVVSRTNGCHY